LKPLHRPVEITSVSSKALFLNDKNLSYYPWVLHRRRQREVLGGGATEKYGKRRFQKCCFSFRVYRCYGTAFLFDEKLENLFMYSV